MSGTDPIVQAFYSFPREPSSADDLVPWARDLTRAIQGMIRPVADRTNTMVQHGLLAARPTADGSRRLYFATDTGLMYYDSGSWTSL